MGSASWYKSPLYPKLGQTIAESYDFGGGKDISYGAPEDNTDRAQGLGQRLRNNSQGRP